MNETYNFFCVDKPSDITRRDYFAAAALSGILASARDMPLDDSISLAVLYADGIILALDAEDKEKAP